MPRRRTRALAAGLLALLAAAGCDRAPAPPAAAESATARERLGLMTSLPLYWPLGAGVEEIASGRAPPPWQRTALEAGYVLEPLDTLSPIPGLAADAPATDPLAGLTRLAVIQPRGLSPADNVALDEWVREGGRLLLVLDPALTGEYDLPLGDPRRPADSALIPPVVARWGLAVRFDEAQGDGVNERALGEAALPLIVAGEVSITNSAAAACTLLADGAAARCRVGKGEVTLIADAALFEHPELAGEGGAGLRALVAGVLG
ncbi:MAG: GldG family protein [Erythrobacter sp.]|uniref:DUF4350 domain-containing protein n=1 Tax=Erythrobacter sp. TaxID=1042 RepID=UPI0025F57878|nr:DUF4350 domain-containing protein [Erythrobacter sp.]MCL9998639.1 GldG family protein [Erythrobacter sp.]